ncbi:NlpC/P60 family protein [Nocardia sp. NBC_01503]|uniref:C40 family peptidase n=1 Tax=Nocardia sp. NBC_01503 TaxID=2975997 RepID=UPI002E7B52FB|nr:NlpC/P60 family protein [Nocardia sp. NBC_01503]WTL29887.1 NlpC/P60 family protein [Nocardia sp. NBC_01503]
MTEAAEVTPESEAVAAEREAPPGTPTPWNRRPPGTAWPPIRPAGPPHPGAAQPPASPAVHPGGPPRPGAADVVAGATPPRTAPGAAATPAPGETTGTGQDPAAARPDVAGTPPDPGGARSGGAAAQPDSARAHSDSDDREHGDRHGSDPGVSALSAAAPALAMLPMMLASLLGGAGGGGAQPGGGAPRNTSGTTDSGQTGVGAPNTSDESSRTLSPQAQAALRALEQLRDAYGKSRDSARTGSGTKPVQTGVRPGSGTGSGAGGGDAAAALSAVQLYQRTAAIAFNNLDNQLAGYLSGLAGTHGIDRAALNSLIKELDLALIKLGTAAYTPAGAQKVHDILTIALREGIRLAGAGQVNASDTAAAIDSLTGQYLYAIAGRNYPGSMPASAGVSAAVQQVIAVATAQVGKPYVWGAEGPNSFDCSGLMQYAARSVGVSIPRVSQDQYRQLPKVNPADIRPGDLIFPAGQYNGGSPTHVMMYLGNGQCVEAPRPGATVRITALPSSYAASRWS